MSVLTHNKKACGCKPLCIGILESTKNLQDKVVKSLLSGVSMFLRKQDHTCIGGRGPSTLPFLAKMMEWRNLLASFIGDLFAHDAVLEGDLLIDA